MLLSSSCFCFLLTAAGGSLTAAWESWRAGRLGARSQLCPHPRSGTSLVGCTQKTRPGKTAATGFRHDQFEKGHTVASPPYSQLYNESTVGNKSTATPKFLLFQAIVPLK